MEINIKLRFDKDDAEDVEIYTMLKKSGNKAGTCKDGLKLYKKVRDQILNANIAPSTFEDHNRKVEASKGWDITKVEEEPTKESISNILID